ncbi:MAG: hypothetical protein BWY66_00281 [bacterium ADurb.Bin374]|nr:MAG: hypothetical protein BWY66_00281 [bacterium ADurb.Bin374]
MMPALTETFVPSAFVIFERAVLSACMNRSWTTVEDFRISLSPAVILTLLPMSSFEPCVPWEYTIAPAALNLLPVASRFPVNFPVNFVRLKIDATRLLSTFARACEIFVYPTDPFAVERFCRMRLFADASILPATVVMLQAIDVAAFELNSVTFTATPA